MTKQVSDLKIHTEKDLIKVYKKYEGCVPKTKAQFKIAEDFIQKEDAEKEINQIKP